LVLLITILLTLCATSLGQSAYLAIRDWRMLAPAVVDGAWIRPRNDGIGRPVWGNAKGLSVGIAPMPGPRGLLRVYAPYLGHGEGRMINFIAVEPIVRGQKERGFSELEFSELDQREGKRFWAVDEPGDIDGAMGMATPRGKIVEIDGVKALRVYVGVERFNNGAEVYLRLTFREDRPYEVGIATFVRKDSAPLERCILTATMGNYARLRVLKLADSAVTAGKLWPEYRDVNFAPHARFSLAELERDKSGAAVATAWCDEDNPEKAVYAAGTREHWRYEGRAARQFWRVEKPEAGLEVLVNGRVVYWNSRSPIPEGIAFENFEMAAPFKDGQEFWFGVEPMTER